MLNICSIYSVIKKLILFCLVLITVSACNGTLVDRSYRINFSDLHFINTMNEKRSSVNNIDQFIVWAETVNNYLVDDDHKSYAIDYFLLQAEKEEEPYRSYLNFLISDIYWDMNEKSCALFYGAKISADAYNLQHDYTPIGLINAQRVIRSNITPYKDVEKYYEIMDTYFNDYIDIPIFKYDFAQFYKIYARMDKSVLLLEEIIRMSQTISSINDQLDLRQIRDEVYFYKLNKYWIYKDLERLIANIKDAIRIRDQEALGMYASRTGFVGKLWSKQTSYVSSFDEVGIDNKWLSNIIFEPKLEEFSNDTEAYIKSYNWTFTYLRTWYFYFKRVDYPYDYRINGGWEWKGIYFGERS